MGGGAKGKFNTITKDFDEALKFAFMEQEIVVGIMSNRQRCQNQGVPGATSLNF